jgi:hypothetical protein
MQTSAIIGVSRNKKISALNAARKAYLLGVFLRGVLDSHATIVVKGWLPFQIALREQRAIAGT